MKPVFEDDFWDVTIDWSKPIPYVHARDQGSDYDAYANLYVISARYSTNTHKAIYIGKTFKQNIQTRLKQPDHRARYAAIVKNYPKHKVFVRYGCVSMNDGKFTKTRLAAIENILIYCSDDGHSHNVKSVYSHGVTDSYQITNNGSRGPLPKLLALGFFRRG